MTSPLPALAPRATPSVTVVVAARLDRFWVVRDVHGPEHAEHLMAEVRDRWINALDPHATVEVLAEGTLSVVAPGSPVAEIVERLVSALVDPFWLNDEPVHVTASLGIVVAPAPVDLAEAHYEAGVARQAAERAGRAQHRVYDPETHRRSRLQYRTELELGPAIERGEMVVHFQPEVDLADRRLLGAEALVRWRHPERGLISPAEFIPIAERAGTVVELTRWVVDEAARHLASWDVPEDFVLRINTSEADLRLGGIAEHLQRAAATHGVALSHFCLELTEHTRPRDSAATAVALAALRERGVKLSLDDFGTGYSSFAELRWLPVDFLKVDTSFVLHLPDDELGRAVITAITTLADRLGLAVVAEGVESESVRAALLELGCRRGQGYLFSPPCPPEEFAVFATRGRVS